MISKKNVHYKGGRNTKIEFILTGLGVNQNHMKQSIYIICIYTVCVWGGGKISNKSEGLKVSTGKGRD